MYERSFGLRAALNLVDPEQIRSVQSRRFADTALHVRRQVSRPSDIVQLDMDVQRDLLTTLEGAVMEGEFGKRVAGADAARITEEFNVQDVPDICGQLLLASRGDAYRARFPWSDQVEQVTDESELAKLDDEALGLLLDGEFDRFDVYPSEMVDEAVTDYGVDINTVVMEPTRELLAAVVRRSQATGPEALAAWLEARQIVAHNDEGQVVGKWSWWECLYYESRSDSAVTVLDRGMWLKVQGDYARAVNDFAAALEPSDLVLPSAKRTDVEAIYNERVARERSDIRLLDRKLVAPIPGESRIEICDLFCQRGHLVHVKRRKGGSSGLSHLFGQALVSSQLLAQAPEFSSTVREQLADWAGCLRDPPIPREHPVVLGLVLAAESSGAGARALPFFSKVFLRQTVRDIRGMGFPVHFDEIAAPLELTTGQRAGGPRPARMPTRRRRS